MRLDAMTVELLRRAITIYQDLVWGSDAPDLPELPGADDEPVTVALPLLADETLRSGDNATARYALRLGNPNYPFMKLVLQEHLVEGEFFLVVDTHDQMFETEDPVEQHELVALRRRNLEIKDAVESAWSTAGLPTARHLKGLVEGWPARREPPNGHHILLVDNDEDIAATLAMLLEARGFTVSVLHDGRDAVEQADPKLHDLILMDNEMKYVNGFEACRVLKSRELTRNLPVLIATAGSLTLRQLDAADGFLVKPFRMELLFSILEHMLGRRERL
jgi:CheY-like chemotaxis protein